MPKIDLNPLQSGGSADPIANPVSTLSKGLMMVVSFAAFFTFLAFGQQLGGWFETQIRNLLGVKKNGNSTTPILGEV